jgi:hypothetical protein
MRNHQTVELEPGRRVIVRELRVSDMRKILAILTPEELTRPAPELLQTHLPELLTLLDSSLQLPSGETIEDLSLSECEAIGKVWWELHRVFFLRALGLIGARAPNKTASPLTEPA